MGELLARRRDLLLTSHLADHVGAALILERNGPTANAAFLASSARWLSPTMAI